MSSHPSSFSRLSRVDNAIKKALAACLQEGLVRDPRLTMVSIAEVRTSKDLHHARVYVSCLAENNAEIQANVAILNKAAAFLRSYVGRQVPLKYIPELSFVYDASVLRGAHLQELIDALPGDTAAATDETLG